MTLLHLDLETRSTCDLKRAGLHVYAVDPSTRILCGAYAFGDEPVDLWEGDAVPLRVLKHIADGEPVCAHNAAFEMHVWNGVLGVHAAEMRPGQLICTMAMSYAMGLPGSLDNASGALGLAARKDSAGHRLMLQLSRPRSIDGAGKPVWWDDPLKLGRLFEYCAQDVAVERELHARLLQLSASEQRVWLLDQTINDRGLPVNVALLDQAILLAQTERDRLDADMRRATQNVVSGCSDVAQLTAWLRFRGVTVESIAKTNLTALLALPDLPADCRAALTLRQEAAKSSVAKYQAMRDRVGADGRMRGWAQYHGAATGRWAARGPQFHNFARPLILHSDAAVQDALAHLDDAAYLDNVVGPPLQVLSDCLRPVIQPDAAHVFTCADFSNIEGRVLAWLAGETWKVQAFRDFDRGTGPDIYRRAYAAAFGVQVDHVTKDQRQVGKVMELALGFGGGVGAFQTMARNYGVTVADATADALKVRWRAAHPRIEAFWHALNTAAMRAVNAGRTIEAGPVAFRHKGSWLFCRLPSGRALAYPFPIIKQVYTPWDELRDALHYWAENSMTHQWECVSTYGGSLAENITQAVARDLLAEAMVRVEAAGHAIVLHVHDEIVVETPAAQPLSVEALCALMTEAPAWASGLPIAAAGWQGRWYRKE